jgi:hypothetical protein
MLLEREKVIMSQPPMRSARCKGEKARRKRRMRAKAKKPYIDRI